MVMRGNLLPQYLRKVNSLLNMLCLLVKNGFLINFAENFFSKKSFLRCMAQSAT
jgi:hypothetical protein